MQWRTESRGVGERRAEDRSGERQANEPTCPKEERQVGESRPKEAVIKTEGEEKAKRKRSIHGWTIEDDQRGVQGARKVRARRTLVAGKPWDFLIDQDDDLSRWARRRSARGSARSQQWFTRAGW